MVQWAVATVFVVSGAAPLILRPILQHWGVIDLPNDRSSHNRAVIRGVGVAPLLAMILGFAIAVSAPDAQINSLLLIVIAGTSSAAGLLGLVEDVRGLRVTVRASLQLFIGLAAVATVVASTGASWWLIPVFTIGTAAYINVTNFMDGINGISAFHAVLVGGFYAVVGTAAHQGVLVIAGLVLAAAFLAFLPWNLFGNGMFLGDVGSYLLGGATSAIALSAIVVGIPVITVVGPLTIYLADVGFTLLRRVLHHERWYEAHRTHTYQKLTDFGFSHVCISAVVLLLSACTAAVGSMVIVAPDQWPLSVILILAIATLYLLLPKILAPVFSNRLVGDKSGTQ